MLVHVTSWSQSTTLMLMTLFAFGLRPSHGLCETRCEQSIPNLVALRNLWARSYSSLGGKNVSFEQFLLALVQVNPNNPDTRVRDLREQILYMIGRFQDCVMACEHQYSKRSSRLSRTRRRTLRVPVS